MADETINTNQAFSQAFEGVKPDQAFQQAFAPPAAPVVPNIQQQQQAAAVEQLSKAGPIPVINPNGDLVEINPNQLSEALKVGYREATLEEVVAFDKEQKYGTAGQKFKTALEGIAEGIAGPLATAAETKLLGVKPEDIRAREEVNPYTKGIAEVAGLAGPAIVSGGSSLAAKAGIEGAGKLAKAAEAITPFTQAGLLEQAGAKATGALGLQGGTLVNQIAGDTVNAAFQMGLYQGGEEISKAFKEDPNQTAESAIADIGMASIIGGVFGGSIGAAFRKYNAPKIGEIEAPQAKGFISELDQPKFNAGDFKSSIEHSNLLNESQKKGILSDLGKEKIDAKEIRDAAKRLNAPVMEGMISDSKLVQRAEDSLINGAPTYSGLRRQNLYKEGYDKAFQAVESSLGQGSQLSKAELGVQLKDSIVKQIEEQNAPIKALYDEIKATGATIPIAKNSSKAALEDLRALPDLTLAPSSPGGKLFKRVEKEIGNLKTVDDVKNYKSLLNQSLGVASTPQERRLVSLINDRLTGLEENAIEKAAKGLYSDVQGSAKVEGLIAQRKAANSQYKTFIDKVQQLSEQLGKGRVHGVQDALNFIKNDLTPEQITERLFSKKNSEFLRFFEKNYPEQMALMRDYQKGSFREVASRTGELSPKVLFNNINKLEPEIQKAIFTPRELQSLKDAETYIRAFPKNFNPSGTSHVDAFREFFGHGVIGGIAANAKDLAIEKFIKAVSAAPEIRSASAMAKATVNGWNTSTKAIKAILDPTRVIPASIAVSVSNRLKLDKIVQQAANNPLQLLEMNENNPVSSYNTAFASSAMRATQYLNSLRPKEESGNILEGPKPASADQKAIYNRALDLTQQPLLILKDIKEGTITNQDITTIKTVYPSLFKQLQDRLGMQLAEAASKKVVIPYKTKLGISMFMEQPLDSTLRPEYIQSAQIYQKQQQPQQQTDQLQPPSASSMKGLEKLAKPYMTPGQAREAHRTTK